MPHAPCQAGLGRARPAALFRAHFMAYTELIKQFLRHVYGSGAASLCGQTNLKLEASFGVSLWVVFLIYPIPDSSRVSINSGVA